MAQSILSIAEKLVSVISDEANFLSGVQDQVQLLINKIRLMRSALQDASEKHRTSKEVEEWLNQVRDVAMEAEDVIDLFIFKTEKQRLRNIPTRYIHYPNLLINLHNLGKKIENSNKKIEQLSTMRSMLGLATSEATWQSSNELLHRRDEQGLPFRGRDSVEEFSVIGFQEEENEIVKKLLIPIEPPRPFRPTVVSIVGMGGIGKTTLVRKVFKNKDVMENFRTRAWYSVSQQCNVKDVLQVIVEQIKPLTSKEKEEELDEGRLIHLLSSRLKKKTYLIVFDDLWRTGYWDKLKQALPVQEEGYQSRVLLTTRNEDVAKYADPFTETHRLRLLTEEESWKLFLTKVMGSKDVGCPQDLEELGRKIVNKCHRLPLAIVVLGGLLSTRPKAYIAWSKVLDSIKWELNQSEDRSCKQVLALSYTDLPDQLKPCFLYVGLFPEDYVIECSNLICLWVAEGFVQPREHSRMEDVAEDYMEELIKRSMIQATSRSYDGRATHCRIHDLVRDLAISEAKQERFLEVLGSDDMVSPNKCRRLSIIEYSRQGILPNHLRSFLCFSERPPREEWMKKSLFGAMKLLRVLRLEDLRDMPSSFFMLIGKLILLKYLSLRNTRVKKLPSSIGDLQNLQTLDLRSTSLKKLPMTMMKLQHLRNFLFLENGAVSERFNFLHPTTDLQILYLNCGKWIRRLDNLTNLRDLFIVGDDYDDLSLYSEALLNAIPKLSHLQSLRLLNQPPLTYSEEAKTVVLPALFFCHLELYHMVLLGVTGVQDFPPNLITLLLDIPEGQEINGLMANLKKLCNLRCLIFFRAFMESEIIFPADGFPQLEELMLIELYGSKEFIVEEGALPNLRVLKIVNCPMLERLPQGLKQVVTLRELILSHMSEELEHRVQKDVGEDWEIIKHIPFIHTKLKFNLYQELKFWFNGVAFSYYYWL